MAVDAAPRSGPGSLHAFVDHVEANGAHAGGDDGRRGRAAHDASPRRRSCAVASCWRATTIDLYLSMTHEEPNPVPSTSSSRGRVALSVRRHEPVGVVTAITPYNAAILMAFQKLIPALMAGNSVILRPSPLTPLSSLIFGAAADAAGLPPGVLSVVVESGAEGAELLTTDPAIDMVSFTGSTDGRQADPRPGRVDGEARRARARRQVGADLPARRGRARRRRGR